MVLAAAAAAALALTASALAGERIDAAVNALRSDPVYVDPDAELAVDDADKARLRSKLDSAGAGPVYIAILSQAAENEAAATPTASSRRSTTGSGGAGRTR